jgi:hypothetical protein
MQVETTPQAARWCALILAGFFVLASASHAWSALQAERTGIAVYPSAPGAVLREKVTRADSPSKFRDAVNGRWTWCAAMAVGAYICWSFYRKLSD